MSGDHNILEKGFKNVPANGRATGFQLAVKTGYYRGVYANLIEGFEVTVDGTTFQRNQIRLTIGGHTYALDKLADLKHVRWQWLEPAILTVHTPGGLTPGLHDVRVTELLRISYMPVQPSVYSFRRRLTLVK
ncbi:MAG TPA: DUF6379 domain-containing protein [Patescibacteria group bacterium]|nr:DUF6379 domain-containing protein [Patescibacteria group bacterium]